VATRPLLSDYSNISSFPAANTGSDSLGVQLGYKHRFCRKDGENATSRRKAGVSDQVAKPKVVQIYSVHADLQWWYVWGGI
jgi:hypothetical protein